MYPHVGVNDTERMQLCCCVMSRIGAKLAQRLTVPLPLLQYRIVYLVANEGGDFCRSCCLSFRFDENAPNAFQNLPRFFLQLGQRVSHVSSLSGFFLLFVE